MNKWVVTFSDGTIETITADNGEEFLRQLDALMKAHGANCVIEDLGRVQ